MFSTYSDRVVDLEPVSVSVRPNPVAIPRRSAVTATVASWRWRAMSSLHIISHPFEQMMAAMALICGGVLERHPKLRVGFFEAGCSWMPYWLARLDDHFEHPRLGRYMAGLTMPPSAYFERQCVVSCDPGDPTIPLAVRGLGAHKILFATDYPHFDSGGGAVRRFLETADLGDEARRLILRDNALAFYGLT